MKNSILLVFSIVPALLAGCSSTHIQSTAHTTGISAAPVRNVTVVGMDSRPTVRNPFEDDVVRSLQGHGVDGTASHTKLSFAEVNGSKEQIRQRLLAEKAESVLFVRVTDRTDFVSGPPASLGSMDVGGG